jgi:hypothetical protein
MDFSNLRFKPYKGKNYNVGWKGKRTLIIGESHHHESHSGPKCDWCRAIANGELTKFAVEELGIKRNSKIFGKIRQVLGDDSSGGENFWNAVAFYNYQQNVLEGPKVPVAERVRLGKKNVAAFIEVANTLKPERLLILGKANWRYFPSQATTGFGDRIRTQPENSIPLDPLMGELVEGERVAYWYSVDNGRWMLVGAIKHPSSVGFSARRWQKWASRFLDAPDSPGDRSAGY